MRRGKRGTGSLCAPRSLEKNYFGGKRLIADEVWKRFGDTSNFVEPFFGSGAVLLSRPHVGKIETVNDFCGFISNFWRSVQWAPEETAKHADWPVSELDLHARHKWLIGQAEGLAERLRAEPEFYDPKIAGWWVWGACQWIGSGWCQGVCRRPKQQLPHLGNNGQGINRTSQQLPHLGDAGQGINRLSQKRPFLGGRGSGNGVHSERLAENDELFAYFRLLSERLRRVRVCCGDWSRVCGPTPTFKHGMTGVFLDPPYGESAGRTANLYAQDDLTISGKAREWAIENGENPLMRIAICGYESEFEMPKNWTCLRWKAHGGYGGQGESLGKQNSKREAIWFSPHCLNLGLFSGLDGEYESD